jgi:hypothetical protein
MTSYATAIGKYVEDLNQWAGSKGANQAGNPKWDIEPLRAAALKFKGDAERFKSWETYWKNFINQNGGYEQMDVSLIRQKYNNRASNFETLLLDLEAGGGVSLNPIYPLLFRPYLTFLRFPAASNSNTFCLLLKLGLGTTSHSSLPSVTLLSPAIGKVPRRLLERQPGFSRWPATNWSRETYDSWQALYVVFVCHLAGSCDFPVVIAPVNFPWVAAGVA